MIEFRTKELMEIGEYLYHEDEKFKEIYEAIQARGWFNEPTQFFYTEEGEQLLEHLAYELDDLWTGGDGWITLEDIIKVYRYGLILEENGYFGVREFKEAWQEFHRSYQEWSLEEDTRRYKEYCESIEAERSMYYFRSV